MNPRSSSVFSCLLYSGKIAKVSGDKVAGGGEGGGEEEMKFFECVVFVQM